MFYFVCTQASLRLLIFEQAYRKAAITCGEHLRFNNFLREIKSKYSTGRHKSFWELNVKDRLSLINSAEDSGSAVTANEAAAFLAEAAAPVVEAVKAPVVEEEEDLFGEMA